MKHIIIAIFSLWFISIRAQGTLTLPYSGSNICLDKIQPIGGSSVTPKNLIVKDFDGDGFVDVLVADVPSGKVFIYNYVSGTFVAHQVLSLNSFGQFNSIGAGRIDSDGLADLVITDTVYKVSVFRNTSTGPGVFSFNASPNYTIAIPPICKSNPSYVKVVDLNKDLFDDFVLALPANSAPGLDIVAFRNTFSLTAAIGFSQDYIKPAFASVGIQTFSPVSPVPPLSVANPSMDMSFGDFIVDGFLDAFITYRNQNDSVLFLANTCSSVGGVLSFSSLPRRSPGFLQTWSVEFGNCEMADIDGDMVDDAVCLISAVQASITINGLAAVQGTNILGSPSPNLYQPISTGTPASLFWPNDFKIADIDNNGTKDLICINNTQLWIYFGNPPPGVPFGAASIFPLNNTVANEIIIANFDQNTLPDILFKPWGTPGGTKVIPNFHYSITAVPANSAIAICAGNTASATILVTPTLSMPHNVEWYLTGAPALNTGVTGPVFTTTSTGVFYPVLNIPFPYTGTASCFIQNYPKDSIIVISAPSPSFIVSPASVSICPGNNATLTVSGAPAGSYSYTWATGASSAVSNSSAFPVSTTGNYTVFGVNLSSNCTASQTANVNVFPPTIATILVSKQKICRGDSANLSVSAQSFTWSTGSNNSSIYVKPVANTQYSVLVADNNGCTSTQFATIQIDLSCDFKVYNVVTPNGDNINDVWLIENIHKFPNNYVEIFNRWGKRIYFTNGYNNESNYWPSPNAKDLTPSTYFYLIDLGDGSPKIKGWLEVLN
jgi:gliding motility-associated-like protein